MFRDQSGPRHREKTTDPSPPSIQDPSYSNCSFNFPPLLDLSFQPRANAFMHIDQKSKVCLLRQDVGAHWIRHTVAIGRNHICQEYIIIFSNPQLGRDCLRVFVELFKLLLWIHGCNGVRHVDSVEGSRHSASNIDPNLLSCRRIPLWTSGFTMPMKIRRVDLDLVSLCQPLATKAE